jgi:AcrR family transcriptional regulator
LHGSALGLVILSEQHCATDFSVCQYEKAALYTDFMARSYTLKRRAERQLDTRRRIVEAAVQLHGELGPARTSLSLVAERAGVQRNTLYAHFPDERSLLLACSALSLERDPLPDAGTLRELPEGEQRLRAGLAAMYAWYERNASLAACVLRDAQVHALTREIADLRYGPALAAIEQVLGAGLSAPQRALLRLALGYATWRSLVGDSGLPQAEAVRLLVHSIGTAG